MRALLPGLLALFFHTPVFADTPAAAQRPAAHTETAILAGGCFWCLEADFEKLDGVVDVVSGYTGGHVENPTYKQVSAGGTGHAESVEIKFDPKVVSYRKLLRVYWHSVDPTVKDRQFCDVGSQYRTAIFYHDERQKRLAEESKAEIERTKPFKAPIVTEIVKAGRFWPAEEYHQDYYKKNSLRYHFYREGCGRDARLEKLWGSLAGKP
jgi:peptide-methionine (S)-S-oxide reductase